PPPLASFLDLDNPGSNPFAWQSGASGQFQTSLVLMPEPSAMTLVLFGMLAGLLPRRRRNPS
ncbi:MAG: hypothetical protein GWO24_22830, partial [Akkermansiaceae bacterium]|nr:hypothetical protein [Akkermansiaceae bacterium]